jgi:hypothetical protein
MTLFKPAVRTSVLFMTAVSALLVLGGPVGCDTTGPGGGSGFPGNEPGTDGRKVLIDSEEWVPCLHVWSPECDRVAFCRSYYFGDYEYRVICVYNILTGEYVELPETAPRPGVCDWSHNGEWILYYTTDTWQTFIIRPDGSDKTEIPDMAGLSFSPDDREIVGSCYESRVVIADISDLNDIKYRYLDPWPDPGGNYGEHGGYWSPDGEHIAVFRQYNWELGYEPSEFYVYLIDPQDGSYEVVFHETQSPIAGIKLRGWSADGRYLILVITANGYENVWVYEIKTGEYTQVTYSEVKEQISNNSVDWGTNNKIVFDSIDFERYDGTPESTHVVIYTMDAP